MATSARSKIKYNRKIQQFFENTFVHSKLNNWFGILLVVAMAACFGYLVATRPLLGIGLFGAIAGFSVAIVCISSAEAGLYITVIYSFFAYLISRFFFGGTMSVGVAFDVLVLITFVGLFVQGISFRKKLNEFVKNPVIIATLAVLFLLAIELFNPNSRSSATWNLAMRKFIGYVLLLFICYNVFSSYEKIKRFLILLFIVSGIAAVYGCKQQWLGYFNFEWQQILSDVHGFGLIYINGEFRKYSTMSDPSAYGILMAVCAVFFLILAINEKDKRTKWLLIGGSMFMILGMGYSGTRTAYAIVVVGLAFFTLLHFDKKSTRVFGIVASLIFLFILYGPIHGNKTVDRFRTTFAGDKDESYKVRVLNRKFVQPYILSHPLGGGLGTTGATGMAEQPGHFLANFQPDSSYLKKAAETGWIGLIVICVLYFLVLKAGIKGFFSTQQDKYKILYAASVSGLFAFYIAEFAQSALGQITDVVVYYPLIAIVLKLKTIEAEETESLESSNSSMLPVSKEMPQ